MNNGYQLIPCLALIASIFAPLRVGAEPLSLDAFLADVKAKNPAVRAARERGDAASSKVAPAGAPEDPFFAVGPDGISSNRGGPELIRYQLSQSVPVPGRLGARATGASERAAAAAADAETIGRATLVLAKQTFYRTLHNQEALALNADLAHLVDDAVESGRARYQTGSVAHHEWLLAKADLAILEAERVRLENERAVLRIELNELRGASSLTPIDRVEASLEPEPSTVPAAAPLTDSPEKRALEAAIRAAEADRRLASLAVLPDFVVQGMLEDPRDEMERNMWGVMVGFTVPLFWPRKQRELVVAADHELRAAEADAAALGNRLAAEETAARAELENAHRTVALYETSVLPATSLAFESARSGYALGRVGLRDLIDVARARRTQQLELLDAKIDVVLARTRLENLLSAPPVLRLAPATPTLFGAGMGSGGAMSSSMSPSSAVRVGSGIGTGAARGSRGVAPTSSAGGMKGM